MSRSRFFARFCLIAIVPAVMLFIVCCVVPWDRLSPRASLTEDELELMESLAARVQSPWKTGTWPSPMPPPFDADPSHVPFWQDQQRIEQVIKELQSRDIAAFPSLVAYSRDGRYSQSRKFSAWYNCTIGEVCIQILSEKVDPDGRKLIRRRDDTYLEHLVRNGQLDAWWQGRSSKTLKELQIEAIQYYLVCAADPANGYTTASMEELRRKLLQLKQMPPTTQPAAE